MDFGIFMNVSLKNYFPCSAKH